MASWGSSVAKRPPPVSGITTAIAKSQRAATVASAPPSSATRQPIRGGAPFVSVISTLPGGDQSDTRALALHRYHKHYARLTGLVARGRVKWKVVPTPTVDSAQMRPP